MVEYKHSLTIEVKNLFAFFYFFAQFFKKFLIFLINLLKFYVNNNCKNCPTLNILTFYLGHQSLYIRCSICVH